MLWSGGGGGFFVGNGAAGGGAGGDATTTAATAAAATATATGARSPAYPARRKRTYEQDRADDGAGAELGATADVRRRAENAYVVMASIVAVVVAVGTAGVVGRVVGRAADGVD